MQSAAFNKLPITAKNSIARIIDVTWDPLMSTCTTLEHETTSKHFPFGLCNVMEEVRSTSISLIWLSSISFSFSPSKNILVVGPRNSAGFTVGVLLGQREGKVLNILASCLHRKPINNLVFVAVPPLPRIVVQEPMKGGPFRRKKHSLSEQFLNGYQI